MVKTELEQRIIDALGAVAVQHGIDVVDVEVTGATKAPCVRVRIDNLDGGPITLDEVTAQNAWVSAVVEELDPVSGSYTLEVSSPGMARPLRRPADFVRFAGQEVELATIAVSGRRKWTGTIVASTDGGVTLELEDGERRGFPFDTVKKCNLKPVYDFKPKKEGE